MKTLLFVFFIVFNLIHSKEIKIKVATYNIQAAKNFTLLELAENLKKIDADIIALQEIDHLTKRSGNLNQTKVLAQFSGYSYYIFADAMDYNQGKYGLAILSKHPMTNSLKFTLPTSGLFFSSQHIEPRILLKTNIQIPNLDDPVTILNTHLDSSSSEKNRLLQVNAINKFIESFNYTTILLGDFNTHPASTSLSEIKKNWTDTWDYSSDEGYTYPTNNPNKKIDYIFLDMKSSHFFKSFVQNEVITSDHLPLITEVIIQQ